MFQSSPRNSSLCRPAPKHKMAVLTFFGLLIPVYFIPKLLVSVFPGQTFLVTLLAVGLIVVLMTYLIMPILTWLFGWWIRPAD